jgi:hypothetical protein
MQQRRHSLSQLSLQQPNPQRLSLQRRLSDLPI